MVTRNTKIFDDIFTFQLSADHLPLLVQRVVKDDCDPRSPIKAAAVAADVVDQPSPEFIKLAGNENIVNAMNILAMPSLMINYRTGGNGFPLALHNVCHAAQIDKKAFVVISPSFAGAVLIRLFANQKQFLDWWILQNASHAKEISAGLKPANLRYESLVYALHSIDLYRRMIMQNQLQHGAISDVAAVEAQEFTNTLSASVKSRDLRWLVPSFLTLTPGLDEMQFDTHSRHFEELTRQDILYALHNEDEPTQQLFFGNAGRVLGNEFHRTWLGSSGFEICAQTGDAWETISRSFLAPTGLGNHLFSFKNTASEVYFNHAALSLQALTSAVSDMIKQGLKSASVKKLATRKTKTGSVKKDSGKIATKHCRQCGKELAAAKKFCTACGRAN